VLEEGAVVVKSSREGLETKIIDAIRLGDVEKLADEVFLGVV
jgi:hypothetical protein